MFRIWGVRAEGPGLSLGFRENGHRHADADRKEHQVYGLEVWGVGMRVWGPVWSNPKSRSTI